MFVRSDNDESRLPLPTLPFCCLMSSKMTTVMFYCSLGKKTSSTKKDYSFLMEYTCLVCYVILSLPITHTFKKLAAPFPFEVLSNHVVSDTKAYRAVPTAL